MYWFGLIMTFFSLFLLIITMGNLMTSRRKKIRDRMDYLSEAYNDQREIEDAVAAGEGGRLLNREQSGGLLQRNLAGLEIQLAKADLLLRPMEYITIVAVSSFLLAFILYMASQNVMMGLLGILSGIILSKVILNMKKNQRIMKLNQQLTDAITLISNGLKAGYSFFQASEMVAREMKPPISDEFMKMIRQMNLGMTAEEALKRLGERVESQDMDLFITAVLIQRQIGGNLAEVLDNITYTIRERIRLKGDIKAKTAQGRISGIILIFLPPALGLIFFMMNPSFMSVLFTTPIGLMMVGMAALLQIIGIFFIIKIVNIEV